MRRYSSPCRSIFTSAVAASNSVASGFTCVRERDPFQCSREETHICAVERERDVMRWVSPNEEESSYIYTQRWWVNRCDCWASEPTWVLGWLDNISIIKINSYLHEYLSESDDLYINPTPLDERNLIKILSAMNKMTHMNFFPSFQFYYSLHHRFTLRKIIVILVSLLL